MVTLNHDLKPADPFLAMETEDKMRRLEASLTPEQWRALGSSAGLGRSDLTRDQMPLFDDLLPETVAVQRAKARETDWGDSVNTVVEGSAQTLSGSQRSSLHIRLDRRR
jgi:hypothetical protein